MSLVQGLLSPAEQRTPKPFSDKLVTLVSKQCLPLVTVPVYTGVLWDLLTNTSVPPSQTRGALSPPPPLYPVPTLKLSWKTSRVASGQRTGPHASSGAGCHWGVGGTPGFRVETKHCDTDLISELLASTDFIVCGPLYHFFSSWFTLFPDYCL